MTDGRFMSRPSLVSAVGREDGFTLIEMLVVMATALIVFGATLAFFVILTDQENTVSSRTAAVNQAEAGLQQLTRDLRNAVYVDPSSQAYYGVTVTGGSATTTLSFVIPTGSASLQQVTWTCPSATSTGVSSCTRAVNAVGAGTLGPARPMIAGVQAVSFSLYQATSPNSPISPPATQTIYPTSTSTPALSSIGVALTVKDISQLDRSQSSTVQGVSNPIVIQTSADLRNFA